MFLLKLNQNVFTFFKKKLYIIIMKRKIFLIVLAFCFSVFTANAEEWDDFSGVTNLWDGQKAITNDEFEKAIDVLQGKQKKKEAKKQKRKIKKLSGGGTSLHSGLDPMKEIKAQDPLKKEDETGQLINIPVKVYLGEKTLEEGYYNVYGEKDKNGEIYLSFYQSQFFKGKVKASETQDDFNSDNINFVKLIPYNEDYVKIAFGSLDFNAYVFLRIRNTEY